jgi:hypothetical protein
MFKLVKLKFLVTLAIILLTTLLPEGDGAPSAALVDSHQHLSPTVEQTGEKSSLPSYQVSERVNFQLQSTGTQTYFLCTVYTVIKPKMYSYYSLQTTTVRQPVTSR